MQQLVAITDETARHGIHRSSALSPVQRIFSLAAGMPLLALTLEPQLPGSVVGAALTGLLSVLFFVTTSHCYRPFGDEAGHRNSTVPTEVLAALAGQVSASLSPILLHLYLLWTFGLPYDHRSLISLSPVQQFIFLRRSLDENRPLLVITPSPLIFRGPPLFTT